MGSIKRFSKKLDKEVVQIASFTSKNRANELISKLSPYFEGVEMGEPTVIEADPRLKTSATTKTIGEASGLTPQQVTTLKEVVGTGKDFKTQEVVILPTDVPDGFQVVYFSAWKQKHTMGKRLNPRFSGGRYSVLYRNNKNECFAISGGVVKPIGDSGTKYDKIINLSSPAFGNIDIGITEGDRINDKDFIGFTKAMDEFFIGRNQYMFASPRNVHESGDGFQKINPCKRINQQVAIRLVRSLQFLNP